MGKKTAKERIEKAQRMKRDPNVEYADEISFADRVRDKLFRTETARPVDKRREMELDEDAYHRMKDGLPSTYSDEDRDRYQRHRGLLSDLKRGE